jgi:hypothetical protein
MRSEKPRQAIGAVSSIKGQKFLILTLMASIFNRSWFRLLAINL